MPFSSLSTFCQVSCQTLNTCIFFFSLFLYFNSSAEFQQKAEEHGVGEGGSSRGSALRPPAPLWRYSAVSSTLSASAVCIVPHSAAYYLAVSLFLFLSCSDTLTSPNLSDRELLLFSSSCDQPPLYLPRAFTCMIPTWSVTMLSSLNPPALHSLGCVFGWVSLRMRAGHLRVAEFRRGQGGVYPRATAASRRACLRPAD